MRGASVVTKADPRPTPAAPEARVYDRLERLTEGVAGGRWRGRVHHPGGTRVAGFIRRPTRSRRGRRGRQER